MKAITYRLPEHFDPREYYMSEADFVQQRKDLLLERETVQADVQKLSVRCALVAKAFSAIGSRLSAEPQTVTVERDTIYLARRDHADFREVPTFPVDYLDIQKLAALTAQLRDKLNRLAEVESYLKG